MSVPDVLSPQERLVLSLRGLYESYGYARFPMRRFEEYALYLENKSFLTSESVLSFTDVYKRQLPGLDRRLTAREYARVRDFMLALGLEGYVQSRESADSAFTPAFMDGESTRLFPLERADAEN